jgi:hypothetical protein
MLLGIHVGQHNRCRDWRGRKRTGNGIEPVYSLTDETAIRNHLFDRRARRIHDADVPRGGTD